MLCPFRKGLEIGYCIDDEIELTGTELFEIKEIAAVLDDIAIISETRLILAKWIADYYMSTIGSVLEMFSPKGLSDKDRVKIKILDNVSVSETSKLNLVLGSQLAKSTEKRIISYLRSNPGSTTMSRLAKNLRIAGLGELLLKMESSGLIKIEYGSLSKKARPDRSISLNHHVIEELLHGDSTYSKQLKRSKRQFETVKHLEHYANNGILEVSHKSLSRDGMWDLKVIRSLEKKAVLRITESFDTFDNRLQNKTNYRDESELELSIQQQDTWEEINEEIESGNKKPILLFGDTGSGKTLLYIRAIKKTISQGRQAILLLPEISLTPQMLARFNAVFGNKVEIIHSRLSERERFLAWQRISNGNVDLVIGPRSALFAPVSNLGLLIIDEEHESSYKQESPEPRYQARDTAVYYANLLRIPIILGSATPSVESMHNAQSGKYKLVRLEGRIDGVQVPEFELIDMVESRKKGLEFGQLSRELAEAILDRVDKGEGVILFQNKRGYSNIQECVNCGNINTCPHCSISLTLHYGPAMLRCHMCGYSERSLGKKCKECGADDVELLGTGTQLIEEDIRKWLISEGRPARVGRLDSDSTVKRGSHEKILSAFAAGEIDILIGTQMVAKGIDIARVTLVGVVSADMQLYIPDFRGSEKLFQLLVQVGGRAGRRKGNKGKVFVQTYNPREFAIQKAIEMDYLAFFRNEVEQRNDAGLPPFRRISRLELSHKTRSIVANEAHNLSACLNSIPGLVQYSPAITPTIEKINDRYRRVITIKSSKDNDKSGRKLRENLDNSIDEFRKLYKVQSRIITDIDTWAAL